MSAAGAQDDDGAAYIAYSSEGNKVMHLARLAPSLDAVAPSFERALGGHSREAPAIFKHAGLYFLFTSGCTGWEPNRAEVFYSKCGRRFRQVPAQEMSRLQGMAILIEHACHFSLWFEPR